MLTGRRSQINSDRHRENLIEEVLVLCVRTVCVCVFVFMCVSERVSEHVHTCTALIQSMKSY